MGCRFWTHFSKLDPWESQNLQSNPSVPNRYKQVPPSTFQGLAMEKQKLIIATAPNLNSKPIDHTEYFINKLKSIKELNLY